MLSERGPVSRLVAGATALLVLAGGLTASLVLSTTAATAAPTPSISISNGDSSSESPRDAILAGEDAQYTISISNGPDAGYNLGFVVTLPVGVTPLSTAATGVGLPVVYGPGQSLPNSARTQDGLPLNTVPAGMQVWVFEDVSDLPGTADFTTLLTVRPDATVFPVGTPALDLSASAFVSSDPNLKPMFDGSTGVGGDAALLATAPAGPSVVETPVRALRITKTEPSPEDELMRGVHSNVTTYTLVVENTGQGPTEDAVLVDYLPAGLEFLGCGATTGDNTADAANLFDGNREYPGAAPLNDGTPAPADCVLPERVETIQLPNGDPDTADLEPGVYTKVTWGLGDLTGGAAQAYSSAAGTPGETTVRYLAAVPLFENTMDWIGAGPADPTSLEQGANLNNNNGASTRQGLNPGEFDDGIVYENRARVAGTYQGQVTVAGDRAASDVDDEQIIAMDLRVLKSVDTDPSTPGVDTDFRTGQLAMYTLDLRTSEYTSAAGMTLVDILPNGLCPAIPAQPTPPTLTGDPWPGDCPLASTAPGATFTGATMTAIDFDSAAGVFELTFAPAPDAIAANAPHQIQYTALMRATYENAQGINGNTSSGDSMDNHVEIEGTTSSIPALAGVETPSGTPAYGDQTVWDDSSAEIVSNFSGISKTVLPRDDVSTVDPAAPCAVPASEYSTAVETGFILGDTVCYRLTVDFAAGIDVRNPQVIDFLPEGVDYVGSAYSTDSTLPVEDYNAPSVSSDQKRVVWELGQLGPDGDRFVPLNTQLVMYLWGEVTSLSQSDENVDKPENLMKYQQENVLGDVFFLRDARAIEVDYGVSLLKGVRDVDGDATLPARSQGNPDGTVFDSNRDGIQVVQGQDVTYRVDLSAPPFDVQDMVVWDALPVGIAAADVDPSITGGGAAFDPGDLGYPAFLDPAYAGRSVIVWNNLSLAAGVDQTLLYTVTIPVGVEVNTDLPNTASIIAYDALLNTGASIQYFPEGSLYTGTFPVDQAIPGTGTRDDSDVYLPNPQVTKTLVETEVGPLTNDLDPNNGNGQATQGELITWSYGITIPADTTVVNGVLRDRGTVGTSGGTLYPYTVEASSVSVSPGALPAGFAFDAATGTLTFPAAGYTPTVATTFTVELTAYVGDHWGTNTTVVNQAQFRSESTDSNATASFVYIEPAPAIAKSHTPSGAVVGGQQLTYTLTASNPAGRPIAYDVDLVDCVPAELENVSFLPGFVGTADAAVALAGDPDCAEGDTKITWDDFDLGAGPANNQQLRYTVTVTEDASAGDVYTNAVDLVAYTLPETVGGDDTTDRRGERTAATDDDVTVDGAGIVKEVAPASAPIGQTVEYTVTATLPEDVIFYDTTLTDVLPAGVDFDAIVSADCEDAVEATCGFSIPAPSESGQTLTWNLGDLASSEGVRTITIVYEAVLTDAVVAAAPQNTATIGWNVVDGDPSTRIDESDTAVVTILDPVLSIAKTVDGGASATVDPADPFDYQLVVTNTGNTPAYNMAVVDDVPAGVMVDTSSLSPAGATWDAGVATGDGGSITWPASALSGPLSNVAPGNTLTLGYEAVLVPSEGIATGETFTNTAIVDGWESFPTGGREYGPSDDASAEVEPLFPYLELEKTTVGTDVAYADVPFGWSLTLTNTGEGVAQTVTATDTLPVNWEYTAVDSIVVAGAAWTGTTTPAISGTGAPGDPQILTWEFANGDASPVLAPGESVVITFRATPTEQALVDAGVTFSDGTRVAHVNSLSGEATDTSGASENEDGPYSEEESEADAYIHSADLELEKSGGALLAGENGTGWTITVSNNGPDTAVGPFVVTDATGALPAGIVVGVPTGTGWTCDVPVRAADGVTGFECARSNPADTLASGAAFPTITVPVTVDSNQAPIDVDNTADVTGETFDPDLTNNEDTGTLEVDGEADLTIVKTVNTVTPQAGLPLTWTITPSNLGPSASYASAANPITVTDVIPTGISDAYVSAATGWTCNATSPATALDAGATLECTYSAGTFLPVGTGGPITLTGTIDSSYLGDVENTAEIEPGETTDPDLDNNSDEVTVTPGTGTTISVAKTQVAPAPPASIVAGSPVTYEITVTNEGPADARGVRISDAIPAGLTFSSAEDQPGSTWTCDTATAGFVECELDAVAPATTSVIPAAPGANTATIRLVFATDPALTGSVTNTVVASADNAPDDEDSTTDGSQPEADLGITKVHPTGSVLAGTSLDYTLTVTNYGPSVTGGPIVVEDTVPAGLVPTSATGTGWDCTITGQDVLCETEAGAAGGLAVDEVADPITVTVDIPSTLAPQTLVNVATVDGPEDDPNPTNDTAEDPTAITASADVSIVKSIVGSGPFVAGTAVDYTLTVTNAGPSVARDAVVGDLVPTGMSLVSLTPETGSGWTCVLADAECAWAEVPVGTTVIAVRAQLDAAVLDGTVLTNTGEVDWTDSDGPHTDSDPEDTPVSAIADLGLIKTAVDEDGNEITEANAGTEVRYLVEVHNYGPSNAAGPIRIADVLPTGVSFVSNLSPEWACVLDAADPQDVLCELSGVTALAVGADAPDLLVSALIDPSLPAGDVVNTATVTSSTAEPVPDPNPNTDDATILVEPLINLVIGKTHTGAVRIGDELTFDLTVRNEGPSTATGVTILDTLPEGLEYVGFAGGTAPAPWECVSDAVAPDGTTPVLCELSEPILPGAAAPPLSITVDVTPLAYASVTNVAVVSADEVEGDLSDNTAEDAVIVPPQSTLVVDKKAVGAFQVGSDATYRITLTNHGPTEDPGPVVVSDTLPAGLTYRSATASGATCDAVGQVLTCTVNGTLAVSAVVEITVTVEVGQAAYPSVTNTAVVSSPTEQLPEAVLTSTATTDVAANPLAKGGSPAPWLLILAALLALIAGAALVVVRRRRA